jgi:putative phosphoribosyl transferase
MSVATAVTIPVGEAAINGDLAVPREARGIVVFAHGSGSGRQSPRNQHVAAELNDAGLATLLIDLLTVEEERIDLQTAELRFDIELLAERLLAVTDWLASHEEAKTLRIGYFGASTGAAAALIGAAERIDTVGAVVSRGGRPDLAGPALARVQAPTLLIVGGLDETVLELNRRSLDLLECERDLEIVPGATHLFEEPGKLDEVARLARAWFERHLQ